MYSRDLLEVASHRLQPLGQKAIFPILFLHLVVRVGTSSLQTGCLRAVSVKQGRMLNDRSTDLLLQLRCNAFVYKAVFRFMTRNFTIFRTSMVRIPSPQLELCFASLMTDSSSDMSDAGPLASAIGATRMKGRFPIAFKECREHYADSMITDAEDPRQSLCLHAQYIIQPDGFYRTDISNKS